MKQSILILLLSASLLYGQVAAQIDSSLLSSAPADTGKTKSLNMDAIYNRPFLQGGKMPVSLGGYVESNWQYLATDGISKGHQFQFRRMSLFVASSIARRVKFLSEIEFENNADEVDATSNMEIDIEYAAMDIEFHPLLNLRGGIILNPIGAYNQNHDGPKWEFTDRPLPMTRLLPATWSNAGMGLYGKRYKGNWMLGYECYLSGGLDGRILDNEEGKTFLPASREGNARLLQSAGGQPFYTGKLALRHAKVGELGLSTMQGIYNAHTEEGVIIDKKRWSRIWAVDFNTTLPVAGTSITGEFAWIQVQLPQYLPQQFGSRQCGGFADVVQPLLKRPMFGFPKAVLNAAIRIEYIDYNVGTFNGSDQNKADDMRSIMPAISFRPVPQTVLRLNYRYMLTRDLFGNPPSKTGGFIAGISTYF
ncbi:MAG: hypothetical protein JNL57_10215 [Bacteroidetes bacterium]|nr:hypothetical protein [Bacteroidota bacterium]